MSDIQYGCVRFEDPHQHNTGWASIGGEAPFRIKGTESLPSDVVFMVNLERNLMYQCGFKAHSRFRSSEYLSLRFVNRDISPNIKEKSETEWMPHSIMSSMGVKNDDWREQVRVMSIIFERVMFAGKQLINLDSPPLYSVDYGVRKKIAPCDPILDRNVVKAIDEATVHFIQCEVSSDVYSSGIRRFTVSIPRVKHAMNIMNTVLPVGKWEFLEKKSIPTRSSQVADWLTGLGGCVLAKVSITGVDTGLNKLINFGSGQTYRRWVTTDELIWLSELGDVNISQAYVCRDVGQLKVIDDIQKKLNKNKGIVDLSLSLGLFMESFWSGVAKDLAPPVHILKDQKSANMIRPFYKTRDLMFCLDAAVHLQSLGVHVLGYGKGNIQFLTDMNDHEIGKICSKVGVLPPTMDLINTDFLNLGNPNDILLGMILKNEKKMLLDTDIAILNNICG